MYPFTNFIPVVHSLNKDYNVHYKQTNVHYKNTQE